MRLAVAALCLVGCRADLVDEVCPGGQSCLALRVSGAVGPVDQIGVRGLEGIAFSPATALTPDAPGEEFALPVVVPIAIGNFAGVFRLVVSGFRTGMLRGQGSAQGSLARGERRLLEVTLAPLPAACAGPCPAEAECLDGVDDDGDGLADCEDPDCDDRVVCVEAADAGQLGYFAVGDGGCSGGEERLYGGGLEEIGACAACTCDTTVQCGYTLFNAGLACGIPSPMTFFNETSGPSGSPAPGRCAVLGEQLDPQSIIVSRSTNTVQCVTNSPSPAPLRWSLQSRFCRIATSSRTCGARAICVARSPSGAAPCVRVPVGESCPSAMPAPVGQWHRADELEDNRRCACGCAIAGNPACDGQAAFTTHGADDCLSTSQNGGFAVSTGGSTCFQASAGFWAPFRALAIRSSGWTGGGCAADGGEVGSARAVGGSILCCP